MKQNITWWIGRVTEWSSTVTRRCRIIHPPRRRRHRWTPGGTLVRPPHRPGGQTARHRRGKSRPWAPSSSRSNVAGPYAGNLHNIIVAVLKWGRDTLSTTERPANRNCCDVDDDYKWRWWWWYLRIIDYLNSWALVLCSCVQSRAILKKKKKPKNFM